MEVSLFKEKHGTAKLERHKVMGVDWPQEAASPAEHLLCVELMGWGAGRWRRMGSIYNRDTQLLPWRQRERTAGQSPGLAHGIIEAGVAGSYPGS